jgi:hypothetical protein
MSAEEYGTTPTQVAAMNDIELQDLLYKHADTYLEGDMWVETCPWCNGTGMKHGGHACDGCYGDGYRRALDELE